MRITTPRNGKSIGGLNHPFKIQGDRGELLRVSILEEDIIRVQMLPDGLPRLQKTWMIIGWHHEANQQDIPFEGRDRDDYSTFTLPVFEKQIKDNTLHINTKIISLSIDIENFHLHWRSHHDRVFAEDREISSYPYDIQNKCVYHYMHRFEDEFYYGFGERSGKLNKKGHRMRMFNMDAMGYDAAATDPLYKHFPVYITFDPKNQIAFGLIYDNYATTTFDMGCEINNYYQPYRYYSVEDGDIDYYLIYGPSIPEVVKKITRLTGKILLPPKWSLGYLGSSMAYTDSPDAETQLHKFLDSCSEHNIPCDMFHLSSGYSMDKLGKRHVFIWNRERIPNPTKLVKNFHKSGVRLAANIKPALLTSHPNYSKLTEKGLFIKEADHDSPELCNYWGGFAAHLDFTNPGTIEWWQNQISDHILSYGIDATWNDNNEYPLLDDQAKCHGYGNEMPIGLIRPIQPLLMTKASMSAQLAHQPNQRPFLLCRSGCLGIQRYAQSWSGDNYTSWNSLKYSIPIGLGLSLSGVYNFGHDVGGFAGPKPNPELFIRWIQNGIFHPRFTIHSWNDDGSVNEPWMYPEILPLVKELIEWRYRLIPFLYSLLFLSAHNGTPIVRPVIYHFPEDPNCWEESFNYMVGDHLLVAPVFENKARSRQVYLPANEFWCHFQSGDWYPGNQTIQIDAPLNQIPLFVRGGGIIPTGKSMRYIGEQVDDLRNIFLFPHPETGNGNFSLIEDDGLSLDYQKEGFTEIRLSLKSTKDMIQLTVCQQKQSFELPYSELTCVLPQKETRPVIINYDDHQQVIHNSKEFRIQL